MRRTKAKLGPRVDLPPFEPWSKEPPPRDPAIVVSEMARVRRLPRCITAEQLVPERVREAYADIWRMEAEELEQEEAARLARRWSARFRRFVDRLLGRAPPEAYRPQRYRFEG